MTSAVASPSAYLARAIHSHLQRDPRERIAIHFCENCGYEGERKNEHICPACENRTRLVFATIQRQSQ